MLVHNDWLLTPERTAVHMPTATAVIADLHLGYDQARRRSGEAVPRFDLDDTVAALQAVAMRHGVRRLIIAGDLLEDGRCAERAKEFLDWLRGAGLELAGIVPGNHDRGLKTGEDWLPLCPSGFDLGGWRVVHGDGKLPRGRVVHGHLHPCLRLDGRVSAPCYLVGPSRLILPAFSSDAAGVNVLGDRRWRSFRCCVVGGRRVLDVGRLGALAGKGRRRC
jgi:putative SbcD/Mre11-related phosphoesterase